MSAPNPLLDDYLYLQPQIIDRLKAQLAPELGVPVEGAERMSQVFESDIRPMVVWVLWSGDRIGASSAADGAQCAQGWMVLLALRNVGVPQDARNSQAGPLLARLHKALHGWRPAGVPGTPKFTRAQGPKPDYQKASAIYPLAFEIPLHF